MARQPASRNKYLIFSLFSFHILEYLLVSMHE